MAIAIVAVVLAIAIPSYQAGRDRLDIAQAQSEILDMSNKIDKFFLSNHRYPNDLSEVNLSDLKDPWNRAYQYLNIRALGNGVGGARKDKKLVPVNSDYDLYSMGKDGETVAPFTAKKSFDDVVRANNGKFIGLAKDY
jgi:general secretion pathway protein G